MSKRKLTARQRAALEIMIAPQIARGAADFVVTCDAGCGATITGSRKVRHAARWVTRWRKVAGTGLVEQVDYCPACKPARKQRGT